MMRSSNRRIAGAAGLALILINSFVAFSVDASAITAAGQVLGPQTVPGFPTGGDTGEDPGVCDELAVPEGNELAFNLLADGSMIYRWNGRTWKLVGPKAILTDNVAKIGPRELSGRLAAGPTFVDISGSRLVASVVAECTQNPNAAPCQLLETADRSGRGAAFAHVTYIRRYTIDGGLPPEAPGTIVGEKSKVPFTALYAFYQATN